MTKVLVIGATGSVGRHVVASLVEGGHEVRALVRALVRDEATPGSRRASRPSRAT
ncbi:NmrA family NAD(P)-binding protein [Kitasatospora xanthocidica]|uniref:NmrA family NAD(P)-binding protein n=1 Tax=Kitasatospora xanthocidica TaxID=83382 RepID=UPI0037C0D238